MPGGDRTGPLGRGPMTGRAAGFCAGFAVPGFANPGVGSGRGFFGGRGGRGGGRGWRNMYYATGQPGWMRAGWGPAPYAPAGPATAADEAEDLKQQAEMLEQSLSQIKQRLSDLAKESESK